MAFDDLARHMASRDGKKKLGAQTGNADQIVAEAAKVDRRMSRLRDLILGPLLLAGGFTMVVLHYLLFAAVVDPTPNPHRPPGEGWFPLFFTVATGAMLIVGLLQTIRGLRGRSR